MSIEKNFYRGLLPITTPTVLYTVPPGKIATLQSIDISRPGGTGATVIFYIYLTDEIGSSRGLLDKLILPEGENSSGNIFQWRGFQPIIAAGTIVGWHTGAEGVNIHISGIERTVTVDTKVT